MNTILINREILKAQIDYVVALAYTSDLLLESKCTTGLYFKDVPDDEDRDISPFILKIIGTKRKVNGEINYVLTATLSARGSIPTDIIKTLFTMSWRKTPLKTEVFNKAIDEILKTHITYNGTNYTFSL